MTTTETKRRAGKRAEDDVEMPSKKRVTVRAVR